MMQQKLVTQKGDIKELLRLIRNYGKDGTARKTKVYLEQKLETFQ